MPLVPILISLIPEVLKLFAPRVQAEVSRATGADPEVSAQFMQSLVDKIAGIPVTTAPQAIAAVASVVDAPPEQQAEKVAELESFSLDYIEKVAPLLDRIAAMEERDWQASEESQDRAAARYKGAEFDPAAMLTYFAIGAVALITVFLGGWITLFLAQKAPVTVEMWAAFTGLIGWLTAKAGSIYDNRFGTTRQSAAKDVIIGELAQRR